MIYFDSCALVKRYLREKGTQAVAAKFDEESRSQTGVFMSVVGYAEVLAILTRKTREGHLPVAESQLLQDKFEDDWLFQVAHVEVGVGVLGPIRGLLKKHPLKGYDAIHLASALWLRDSVRLGKFPQTTRASFLFATSDRQLKTAAAAEGLKVFDPEDNP